MKGGKLTSLTKPNHSDPFNIGHRNLIISVNGLEQTIYVCNPKEQENQLLQVTQDITETLIIYIFLTR